MLTWQSDDFHPLRLCYSDFTEKKTQSMNTRDYKWDVHLLVCVTEINWNFYFPSRKWSCEQLVVHHLIYGFSSNISSSVFSYISGHSSVGLSPSLRLFHALLISHCSFSFCKSIYSHYLIFNLCGEDSSISCWRL